LFHEDGRTDGKTDRQTDRRTDMIKLLVAFCNFAIAPKMNPWTICEIADEGNLVLWRDNKHRPHESMYRPM